MSNWPEKTLGDLVEFLGGGTPRRDRPDYWGGNIPWASVKDLQSHSIETTLESITPEGLANSASNLVPSGTVVIATRVGLGKVAINTKPVAINQDLKALVLRANEMLPRYLLFFLLFKADYFERIGVGTTVKGLTIADYGRLKIALPPLSEQERIVGLLDEADELRMLRARADRLAVDLIPALFHEMFGDPLSNPKEWPIHRLADVCEGKRGIKAGPFGSSLKKESYTPRGPRVYGQEQVISGDFSVGDYHISETRCAEMSAYKVAPGDLLISLVGTIGKVTVVPEGIEPGIINPRLLRIRPRKDIVHPDFLANVLTHASVIEMLSDIAGGSTMSVLNAGLLKRLSVPVPPLSLQMQFSDLVDEVRKLEADQAASRLRLEALFQSLLHHALNGEL
jgi:type I restriction enzyme S subunit